MSFNPKVSIVIPVYNGSNYLREAIDSALAQTYKNIEVIVVNDGSNDGGKTEAIAISYGDRIRYFYKENGGVATALNLGIQKAEGEYISWLSHDDLYLPGKIEKQIEYLEHHNDPKTLLYSDFKGVDVRSQTTSICKVEHPSSKNEIYNTLILLFRASVHGCTLLLPRSCFRDVGLFNENLKTTQDYELWFKLLKRGYKFIHMPEVLIITRWHEEQGTIAMSDIHYKEVEECCIWAFDFFHEDFKSFSYDQIEKIVLALRYRTLKRSPQYILKSWQRNNPYRKFLLAVIEIKERLHNLTRFEKTIRKLYQQTLNLIDKKSKQRAHLNKKVKKAQDD